MALNNLALLLRSASRLCALARLAYVLAVHLPVVALAGALGVWLFYVQHSFEESYWVRQDEWDPKPPRSTAARSTTCRRVLRWITGNIGYHHIHHLAPRIPNYHLRAAHESLPALRPTVRMGLRDSLACARMKLWDERLGRMVGFPAAATRAAESPSRVAKLRTCTPAGRDWAPRWTYSPMTVPEEPLHARTAEGATRRTSSSWKTTVRRASPLRSLLNASGYDEIRAVRSTARRWRGRDVHPAIAFLGTPAPDGIEGELAALLQKNSRANGIRLIGLTDRAEHPTREEARASGVERYLSKPVTQIELEKALRKTPGG